jgi:F0F1-type ATP synthase beta subunit
MSLKFSLERLENGDYDDLPEGAFYMVGNIEDVKKKAAEMAV